MTEVSFDPEKVNLDTVISAAQWGALTLNNCEVVTVERKDDFLLIGIQDHVANVCYEVKAKSILKPLIVEEENHADVSFEVPKYLMSKDYGICFPEKNVLLVDTSHGSLASFSGSNNVRESFEKLKTTIRQCFIIRKGNITNVREEARTTLKSWEITTCQTKTNIDSSKDPIDDLLKIAQLISLRGNQMNEQMILDGGHGWTPSLPLCLISKYGLSEDESKYLVKNYGDNASNLARKVQERKAEGSKNPFLEVETSFACQRMSQNIDQLMRRLENKNEDDIISIADVMAQELDWSQKVKEKQIGKAQEFLASLKLMNEWKEKPCEFVESKSTDKSFIDSQKKFFQMKSSNTKKIQHCFVEEALENHHPPVVDETLNQILRTLDNEKNGEYTEEEFLEIMKRVHVKTPEEVIENHVQNIRNSNI